MAAKPMAAVLAALACLVVSSPADGATRVFTPAATVGQSGASTGGTSFGAILAADGSATIAWPAVGHGVEVAERPPGGGAFAEPQRISEDAPSNMPVLALAANEAGVRAVGWIATTGPTTTGLEVAVAPAGAPFGAEEQVPLPPRGPGTTPERTDERYIGGFNLAVAPDGSVLVSYLDYDSRSEGVRGATAVRHPDGTWTEAQVLDDNVYRPPVLATDANGMHVIWSRPPHGSSDDRMRVLYEADALPDGHFGEPQLISEPDRDADNGGRGPQFVSNRRGDLLVVWGPEWFNYQVEAAFRPAGGQWQQPRVMSEGVPNAQRPTAAMNDVGDALVAWTDGISAWARFRPAGADWGPPSSSFARQGSIDTMPAALDPAGNGLIVTGVSQSQGTVDSIAGFELPRGEQLAPAAIIDTGTDPVSQPAVATDGFGNGLVMWVAGQYNQPSTVRVASYSGAPPAVTAFRAHRSGFKLRVSEPARVKIVVKGRHRSASEWARIPRRGAATVPFSPRVRALLKRHGRYTATIRARDPGPRASRPRTVTIKR